MKPAPTPAPGRGRAWLLIGVGLLALSGGAPPPDAPGRTAGDRAGAGVPVAPALAAQRPAVHERLARHCHALSAPEVEGLADAVVRESARHGFAPALVLAVIEVESGYDPFAVSPVGALGLMQLLPPTAAEVAHRLGIPWRGDRMLFDPATNVRLGVAYLSELRDRYGKLPVALAAYNWGPGHIDARLRRGSPMPERYPRLVLAAYSARGARGPSDS